MTFSPGSPAAPGHPDQRAGAAPQRGSARGRSAAFPTAPALAAFLTACAAWGPAPALAAQAVPFPASSQPFQLQLAADSRMQAPLTVSFSATVPAGYRANWDLGDGEAAAQPSVTHT